MDLFKADLYRALAVGFLFGALAVCIFAGGAGHGTANVVPSAIAADNR